MTVRLASPRLRKEREDITMNYEQLAKQIIKEVGGDSNIANVTHCMTRLRLSIIDLKKIDDKKIQEIKGVMGTVMQGDEYQIIIGSNVDIVYKKVTELIQTTDQKKNIKKNDGFHPISWILELMSASLSPLIPVIMGAAFITIVLSISEMAGMISTESQTYQVLNAISSCVYHFFPVMIAYTASKQLKVNQTFAIITACFLLFPDFIALFNNGETALAVFGIPVKFVSYSKQIFPILFSVMAQIYIEKAVYKIIPKQLKTMVASGIIMVVSILLAITVFGPLGALLTDGVNAVVYYVVEHMGWVSIPIIAFINPFMLGTGLGSAVFPIMITSFVANGYESLILPAALAGNAAQVGAGLAIAWMSKDKELKSTAIEGSIAALFGVTEPIIFTVHYKLKRTFISVMIASGIAAIIPGFFELKCYALANGIFSLPAYLPGGTKNFIVACCSMIAGLGCGFVVTKLIGFKEEQEPKTIDTTTSKDTITLVKSPLQGQLLPLTDVKDKVFSQGMVGQGVAIIPETGIVTAPVNGQVTAVFPTSHAIGITSDDGVEVLIHIGVNTVKLKDGEFESFVQKGDHVVVGDTLISFDLEKLRNENIDVTTSVVITNPTQFLDIFFVEDTQIKSQDKLMTIIHMSGGKH